MEYPGSKITKSIRYGILFFFLGLFFAIAPVLVLYTSGYKYDWTYGLLHETGSINIDIEPKNASVFINNVKIKSKIPIRLTEKTPGKYDILIKSPGYFDWYKEIEVKNKQTVYLKEISILKKNEQIKIIDGDITNIHTTYDEQYIIYTQKNNNLQEIHIFNTKNQENNIIKTFNSTTTVKITIASQNNYFTISEINPPYNTILLVNAEDTSQKIELTNNNNEEIIKYQWKNSNLPELFYSTKSNLYSIKPTTGEKFLLAKINWIDWFAENNQFWAIKQSTTTNKIYIIKNALGSSSKFAKEDRFDINEQQLEIMTIKNDNLLLKKANRPEMIILTSENKFNISGEKFHISKYDGWMLIWTPWEIWTYVQNKEPNLLNRSGEQLINVIPLNKYNTLGLIWDNRATALYPYHLVTHDILNNSITSAIAATQQNILYFSAKINNEIGLWKLDY